MLRIQELELVFIARILYDSTQRVVVVDGYVEGYLMEGSATLSYLIAKPDLF